MALTARDIALQLVAQLKVLDPSISAEIGTPERLLIDVVAQKIADSTIDLDALAGSLNIDSKVGLNLDKFLSIFNFGRKSAVAATGFVTFSRSQPALTDIRIPAGQQVVAPTSTADIWFRTTFDVTIRAGESSVTAPIQAVVPGVAGNVAAQAITEYIGGVGFDSVTNDAPTSGGVDQETDDQYKVRFKNTVFRNVSGTTDQYLALAIATPNSTKANVIGPISRYREYIQVPALDDRTSNDGNGSPNEYTTALSTIPFSKHIYDNVPYFVSNGKIGPEVYFYRQDTDFVLNTDPDDKNRGDAYRDFEESQLEGYDEDRDPTSLATRFRPNVTFKNVLDPAEDPSVQGVRPGDVVLFEHSYMSSASRNDYHRNITNAVDVFVDGGNATLADCVIPIPSPLNTFTSTPTHPYYTENYRRVGEADHRPLFGNIFTPLFFQPVVAIPDGIKVNNVWYFKDVHYWLVEDVSELAGTVRARNGIEWDKYLPGMASGDDEGDPTSWSGPVITLNTGSVAVEKYSYDKNIYDLQAAIDAAKQTTTDVLAHKAKTLYFKLDITVMYTHGASVADTNQEIRNAVQTFFEGQYFGTTIQLSDLLQVIHNVPGVDNVRWSRDVDPVIGANINGSPRRTLLMDRIALGKSGETEQLQWYFVGDADGGSVTVARADTGATATLQYNVSSGSLQSALRTLTNDGSLTVSGNGVPEDPWVISYGSTGARPTLYVKSNDLTGGPFAYAGDFFLRDDELPSLPDGTVDGDTVPGLTIRARAQNTWGF